MGNKKLYVGNLPYSSTEDQLKELFSQAGTVESARIITDKYSGRSKGFAFVEMSSAEEAQKAIQTLNKVELDGRALAVSEARPQEDRPRFGGGHGNGGGSRFQGGRGGYGGGYQQ
ncbi:RNA-binding protein [Candidatus Uhrbacteria bacterium]|nr:RNA-binding protein [Candidatus Uhrbacteria bacterium]